MEGPLIVFTYKIFLLSSSLILNGLRKGSCREGWCIIRVHTTRRPEAVESCCPHFGSISCVCKVDKLVVVAVVGRNLEWSEKCMLLRCWLVKFYILRFFGKKVCVCEIGSNGVVHSSKTLCIYMLTYELICSGSERLTLLLIIEPPVRIDECINEFLNSFVLFVCWVFVLIRSNAQHFDS